ncbi:transcriptional regulator [Rhodococcus sp. 06-470-2]|uniref:helix-turn-helix domain-containing protein n=1 Tax=unclassified Rhodococcus (in: high G+C Gram-positive bacteria) TaxID=192944 RepID=UPI000B9B0997|nr:MULTISPECIES: helix-turn-helix domain-containing protein [unclassified Rhodococcus (in: high G+C Gram-positive bacteria)]OZC63418.1 transcriptional regulator [Rhodococcus sp. 06-470-2]OZE61389.1 transcriptional regulator [Rhodococcus sp. 05-2221-1B]
MAEPRRRVRKHPSELAEAFVARRHQLSMTQAELALLAGVGRSTVQALEAGKDTVQLDGAVAVAQALGCEITLLTRAGSPVPPMDAT